VVSDGTAVSFGSTIRRLAAAQKPPAQGSPAYSRFVNRRLGRVLAAASHQAGLTPDQVSAVSAVCSAIGVALVALVPPTGWSAFAVTVALVLGYAFDSADGQVARLRGGGTPAGEWLDHVLDAFKTAAVHLSVLICWYRFYGLDNAGWYLVPIAFTLVASGLFFAMWVTDRFRRAFPDQAPPPATASRAAVLRSLLVAPTDYGVLILSFVLLAVPAAFMTVYGLLLAGTALFTAAALPKWFREVSRLGATPVDAR
jgi:phosphatidylglycerophosphate synthase